MAPKGKSKTNVTEEKSTLRRSPMKRKATVEEEVVKKKSKTKETSVSEAGGSSKSLKIKDKGSSSKWIDIIGEQKLVPVQKTSALFRYTLSKPIELINSIRTYMTEEMKEEISKTPFSQLFDAMAEGTILRENYTSRPTIAILDVLCRYKKSTKKFVIGGKELEFKPEDVSLLLGMPMEGSEYEAFPKKNDLDPLKCAFLNKYFKETLEASRNKNMGLSSAVVGNALIKCVRNSEPAIEFVQLLIMMFSASFLFATLAGFTVLPSIYKNIQSRRAINRVSWPRAIHSYMMETIEKHSEDPTKASGCLLLLPFWVCMHTNLYAKNALNETRTPRFLRWSVDGFKNGMENELAGLEPEEVYEDVVDDVSEEEKEMLKFTEKVVVDIPFDEELNRVEKIEALSREVSNQREEIKKNHEEIESLRNEVIQLRLLLKSEKREDSFMDDYHNEGMGQDNGDQNEDVDNVGEKENVNDEMYDGVEHDDKVQEDENVEEQQQEVDDGNVPCTAIVLVPNEEEKQYSSTPKFDLGIDFTNAPDFTEVVQVAQAYQENAETERLVDDDFVETTPTSVKKKRTKSKAIKGGSDRTVDGGETPKQNSLIKRIKQAPRTRKQTEKAEPKEKAEKDKKKEIGKKEVVNVEEQDKKGKGVSIDDDEPLSNWKKSKVWKKVKDNEKGLLEEFNQGVKMK